MKQVVKTILLTLVGGSALVFGAAFLLGVMVLINGVFFPDPGNPPPVMSDVLLCLILVADAAVIYCHIVAIRRIIDRSRRER